MYEEFWNLKQKPFENVADPRFFYTSKQHEEALSRLFYVVKEEKGCGMLTGVFGCGKTLLCHTLLSELVGDIYKVVNITNPRMDELELYKLIVYYLGVEQLPKTKSEVLITLEKLLYNNFTDGKKTVLIIDEAHTIDNKNVFEELRLLLNFQTGNKFLLSLLLIGQPELREKVETNKQFTQRIAIRFHLMGFSLQETTEYIYHRIQVVAGKPEIFPLDSTKIVYEYSGGIPRRINQICDMALLTGFSKNEKTITPEIVEEAVASMGEGWGSSTKIFK